MLQAPSALFMALAFLALLAPLVVIHELGHYLVARWCGVKADAFSVGFGRELVGWTDRRGTRWKLSMLPFGGYVMFAGDANAMSEPLAEDSGVAAEVRAHWLQNRPLWQRALVVAAGPFANLLLAVAILTGLLLASGEPQTASVITGFANSSPARAAGMQVGDRITAIGGEPVTSFEDIAPRVRVDLGEPLDITVLRQGRSIAFRVTPISTTFRDEFGNEMRAGLLGVGFTGRQIVRVGPLRAITLAVEDCAGMVSAEITGMRQIITGARSTKEMGGPIKIAQVAGEQMSLGWQAFAYLAGFVSINLAFMNLLPIPALDGGHLLFYAAEAVRRKPLDKHSQEWAFRTGLAFVLGLMLFVTFNDIASLHLFGGHIFGG